MNKEFQQRKYYIKQSCVFSKTKDLFGGLSNMSGGFPLLVNNIEFLTSEALYQTIRFTNHPNIQLEIIRQKSPITAKMISRKHIEFTRNDWEDIKINVMRWCLKVKLFQNFNKFGNLLESTLNKPIVEYSYKDTFWGAKKINDDYLYGVNALGRLLMELREFYVENKDKQLIYIEPLKIKDFKLLDNKIPKILLKDNLNNNEQLQLEL